MRRSSLRNSPASGRTWAWVPPLLLIIGCHTGNSGHEVMKVPVELPMLDAEVIRTSECHWPQVVRVQGSLVADESAVVGAKVAGRVARTHVDLGSVVKKGDPLTTLEITDFELRIQQAQAQLAEACASLGLSSEESTETVDPKRIPSVMVAKAVWQEARETLDRMTRLKESRAISQSDVETQQSLERVASAQYESALRGVDEKIALIDVKRAELAMARQSFDDAVVRAPFDGVVQQRHVAEGVIVQQGADLVTLVRTDPLRFRGRVPEVKSLAVRQGQPIRIRIEGVASPVESVVKRISPTLDEQSRSLRIEADIKNASGGFRSGLFAEGEIVVDASATTLAVNPSAVGEFAGVHKVWLVTDAVAAQRPVEIGRRAKDQLEILSGLSVGQWILADFERGRPGRIDIPLLDETSTAAN